MDTNNQGATDDQNNQVAPVAAPADQAAPADDAGIPATIAPEGEGTEASDAEDAEGEGADGATAADDGVAAAPQDELDALAEYESTTPPAAPTSDKPGTTSMFDVPADNAAIMPEPTEAPTETSADEAPANAAPVASTPVPAVEDSAPAAPFVTETPAEEPADEPEEVADQPDVA